MSIHHKLLLYICVEILLQSSSEAASCDRVVKENDALIVNCSGKYNEYAMNWYVYVEERPVFVGQCTHNILYSHTQCHLTQSNYNLDYEIGNFTVKSSPFTTYLKVFHVPRTLTQVACVKTSGWNRQTLSKCEITTVVPPYSTYCNSSVANFGQTFLITCTFLVYPQGRCRLNSQFALPESDIKLQTTYSHKSIYGRALYETTCTIEGIVHNIMYTPFRVEVWPDVDNGDTFSTLSNWISLDNFDDSLVFTVNKLTTHISVNKQHPAHFLCHVNNIPDLTLTLYKGNLRQVIYRSPVVNTLQYTLYMTSCGDSEEYICRAENDVIIEKRITVNLKSCGTDETTTYDIVVYTAVPLCLIILIVIITITVVNARRKIKLRNALDAAHAHRPGDLHMSSRPVHDSHQSRNSPAANQTSYDVRFSGDPPSYSAIFHTSANNDVLPSADIPAFYPLPPPYETVYTQVQGEPQRDVTQCNQENNKHGDSTNNPPPPYPGSQP
ncbi:uncharacterized protein LOC131934856 [Physella acuta]|uniref:uncharacterized protein LOC131934856 n=1 Tax=Physella acuta TaxID=109671 RepID=UPI0027DCF1B2|nr:uncharacterized protein LOC131934856 [Physella acuta]